MPVRKDQKENSSTINYNILFTYLFVSSKYWGK